MIPVVPILIFFPLLSTLLLFCTGKKSQSSSASPAKTRDHLETGAASQMTSFPYKEVEEKTAAPMVSVYPTCPLEFKAGSTCQKRVTIKNVTKNSIIYSIQPSCPEFYRTAPVSGILAPKAAVNVIVTHTPSEENEEKLVIINSEAPKNMKEKHVTDLLKGLKPMGGNVEVVVIAK